jgi:hypothetical protein
MTGIKVSFIWRNTGESGIRILSAQLGNVVEPVCMGVFAIMTCRYALEKKLVI